MESCGYGSWFRPAWLQRFATPFWFLVVYGVLGTTQAMAFIYFVATLTTVEKRFKIPSKTAGLLMSGNEISQIILSLILSYYGGQGNRPRWIAAGVSFAALSCFILALPHLVYGAGPDALDLTEEFGNLLNTTIMTKGSAHELCLLDDSEQDCAIDSSYATMPLVLIFISQFVLGVGTTLYYALGQTYLDDNTKKSKTPLMLGCVLALRTIGPAFGFMLGFACLNLYIDPSLTPIIEKDDPRWLGAWWLGWVILGFLKFTVALLIALFPRELPRRPLKDSESNHVSEVQPLQESSQSASSSVTQDIRVKNNSSSPAIEDGFFPALKRLLRNKLLMCNNLSTVFYILGASGYITFVMKYIETQFQQAAASATGFAGCIAISAMVIGFLVSGIVISKYKPRTLYVLSWNVLTGSCYLVCEIIYIFLTCPNNNPNTKNADGEFDLLHICNADCSCSNKYSPICDTQSGTTYYSACYAGCTGTTTLNSSQVFSNCSCITTLSTAEPVEALLSEGYLIAGPCATDCSAIFLTFLAIQFFMHLLGNTGKIGNILITYRCVKVEDKSFAQGLTLFMISLFAFIPGPILYGAIIDSTCLVWEDNCGSKGNCWLYNKDDFRLYMNLTAACLTFIGVVFDGIVCILGKSLPLYDEDTPASADHEDGEKNISDQFIQNQQQNIYE